MGVLKNAEHLPYAIIHYNFNDPAQRSVVEIVKGQSKASWRVERWSAKLTDEDKKADWSYFCERTTLKPSTDPELATEIMRSDFRRKR